MVRFASQLSFQAAQPNAAEAPSSLHSACETQDS
eukprot:CAMPEP_0185834602 /NCGR_PEP_ID=MMETSP1353-20130828/5733_1 /TAXON_ID=1077150 /ORGANISM="Erythrolobus australicus, Strain CCMP3124" /LENGTH=33 /DNA_ID= /DNA_START= /DNA_END= /DNA_ORIENTATION=